MSSSFLLALPSLFLLLGFFCFGSPLSQMIISNQLPTETSESYVFSNTSETQCFVKLGRDASCSFRRVGSRLPLLSPVSSRQDERLDLSCLSYPERTSSLKPLQPSTLSFFMDASRPDELSFLFHQLGLKKAVLRRFQSTDWFSEEGGST